MAGTHSLAQSWGSRATASSWPPCHQPRATCREVKRRPWQPHLYTAASPPEEEFAFVFWILRTHQFLQKQLPRQQEARCWASSQLYTQPPIFSNANWGHYTSLGYAGSCEWTREEHRSLVATVK